MKEEFITALKPGDIFKLNNTGIDVHRIVTGVTVEHCDYFPYTLVWIYYVFTDEDSNGRIYKACNNWSTMKRVYKVLI
jgi:hypothetical protein